MNFAINEEQRGWQMKAREFAREEVRPLSLQRDQIEGGREPWDWEIIKKGSKLGFRTQAVPRDWGGEGTDFVTQGLVMAELAWGDSAISKAFSQNWKWSHLIAEFCSKDQKERFLKPFLADDTYVIGSASTEPNSGSDNRYPPLDAPKAGWRLRTGRAANRGPSCPVDPAPSTSLGPQRTGAGSKTPMKPGCAKAVASSDRAPDSFR